MTRRGGMMKIKKSKSDEIIQRILEKKGTYFAHDNISQYIEPDEMIELLAEVQSAVEHLLKTLIIDTQHDPHAHDTSKRIAKMFLSETLSGRYYPKPIIKSFDNTSNYHDLIILGPIMVNSMCSHHFVPVIGTLFIGIISDKKIWGISKFSRICNWFLRRPHIQEQATQNLANLIDEGLQARGVMIQLSAKHFCMTWRGVHEKDFVMTTVAKTGVFQQLDYENRFYELLAVKQNRV